VIGAVTACRLLVVDDSEVNRELIGMLLAGAGFADIAYAGDGETALRRLMSEPFDLVILDIVMPGLDGFAVCRRLREERRTADLPVLVQTALTGAEDRSRAFAAGATDLLSKPIDRDELLARVRIQLENRLLIRGLQGYRDRLEQELALARSMYDHLLPAPGRVAALAAAAGVEVAHASRFASELGGDLWGLFDAGGGRLGAWLLDVAGRGVSAALNAFRLHGLVQELQSLAAAPAELLAAVNSQAAALLAPGEHATLVYGVIDPAEGAFAYAAAAAPSPLVIRRGSGLLLQGDGTGLPLGVAAESRYELRRLPLPPGSGLLLHSNALLEAAEGDVERLGGWLRAAGGDPSGLLATAAEAGQRAGQAGDDMTILWFYRP